MDQDRVRERDERTAFPVASFFSVPMIAPLLCAALSADLPLTTVSRGAPAPRVLLPIFVTVSQSSMVNSPFVLVVLRRGGEVVCSDRLLLRRKYCLLSFSKGERYM
jgi:hypothetical protein